MARQRKRNKDKLARLMPYQEAAFRAARDWADGLDLLGLDAGHLLQYRVMEAVATLVRRELEERGEL